MESDDEDRRGDEEHHGEWGGVSARVVLLDATSPCGEALSATFDLMQRMMIEAPKHLVGVAVCGTKQNDDKGLENVVQLFDLQPPSVDGMLQLRNSQHLFEATCESFNMANALWQASRMFSRCKKKTHTQIVDIMSHFPEPHDSDKRSILQKASDLKALGIEVRLVNVSDVPLSEHGFYLKEFSRIIDVESPEPLVSAQDILESIWRTSHAKAASAKLKLCLGGDVSIGVGLYHTCKPRNLPPKLLMHRETNEPMEARSKVHRADDSHRRVVLLSETCAYQTFGERRVELTHSELTQLRKFGGAPRMTLLGFKAAEELNASEVYLQPCALLYPDEESVRGSSALFRCLRDRCIAKARVPLCLIVPRWYSHPRLVALLPQNRIGQLQPDAFHVVYLPYAENVREVPLEPSAEITDQHTTCMTKIIKKLRFEYASDSFDNPKLQSFYAALKALALDEEAPAPPPDVTQPDFEMQRDRLGGLLEEFTETFGEMGASTVTKRKATAENGDGATKRRAEVECPDLAMLAARVNDGLVGKYTVAQLKDILRWRNPPDLPALTGLKKDQLVELVLKCCSDVR